MKKSLSLVLLLFLLNSSFGQALKAAQLNKEPDSVKARLVQESNQFRKLKGKLPFPVDSMVSFDFNDGPVYNHHLDGYGCSVNNLSIMTLTCRPNTTVKAVTSCTVALITYIGDTQAIVFRSGNYFICYCNLKNVMVKKGDTVKAGDVIGNIPDSEDGNTDIEVLLSDAQNKRLKSSEWFNPATITTTQKDNIH